MTDSLIAALEAVLPGGVRSDAASCEQYGLDWTRFYQPAPVAVVFPRSTEDVVNIVRIANEAGAALVPSGGRTGLSGGAVAMAGEVVVSFDKMDNISDFNPIDNTVKVGPGVVTGQLQAFAEAHERYYPVDFASSGSSQIGGNIATNAGGIKVLRYGLTRDWVAGLKVVTGAGDVLDLNKGLVKNATGYDLRHLFIGSEGTLGFIVEATMKLAPPPDALTVMLLAVPDMSDTISILQELRSQLPLTAFEFFSDKALRHVLDRNGDSAPFAESAEYYVLAEYEAVAEAVALGVFETCVEQGWVTDGVLSQSEQQARDLWRLREDISESITPFTPYKNDIAVTISAVPDFLRAVDARVTAEYPMFDVIWFGHIGDGNLHLNILKPADWEVATFKAHCEKVSEAVLGLVAEFDGSVSAEHGVGLLKRDQLGHTRSAAEIAILKGVKAVLDPNGVMNPGKLLAPSGS